MRYIPFLFILLLIPFLSWSEEETKKSAGWKYLQVHSNSDSLNIIKELNIGAKIDFTGDSLLIISHKDSVFIQKDSRLKFLHIDRAPLWVVLEGPHPDYDLSDIPITVLTGENNDTVVYLSDHLGSLAIEDLLPGEFSIEVRAEHRGLVAAAKSWTHQLADTVTVALDEFPVAPVGLELDTIVLGEEDLYDVDLIWPTKDLYAYLPYSFLVNLDENEPVVLDDNFLTFKAVEPGDHVINFWAVTPLGVETDIQTYEFNLPNPSTAAIYDPDSENHDEQYYDTQGMTFKNKNLHSGMFIRVSGKKSHKILKR